MKDITNIRFGSLVALRHSHSGNNYQHYWVYLCDCGKEHTARASTIKYETRKGDLQLPSCGCIELSRKTKHGFRKAFDTHPAYRAYRRMMSCCYNPTVPEYKWYGAKGVTVCEEWKNNPQAFVEWSISNGWSKGLHIDKDNICKKLGITPHIYSPDTCQWTTPKINVGAATNRNNYGKHPNVRLSHEEVAEIEQLYFSGECTNQSELARMYGLQSSKSIGRLIKLAIARSGVTP